MTDTAAAVSPLERLEADHHKLLQQHRSLIARLQAELDRTRGTLPPHQPLLDWAAHALTTDIPLELLADCLPYSGAGPDEATHLIDHLADAGWTIVPTPRSA